MNPFAGMRWNWPVLASAATIVSCAVPAAANQYLTEAQALQVIFGADVAIKHETKSLSEDQRKKLESASGLRFRESSYSFSIVERRGKLAGYALILDEIGKSEPITFMVGISPEGKVIDIAIMVFRESRGWEVKESRFLHQFHNKRASDPIQIDRDLINYSGATLSSRAIARGVKRALLLEQEFYPPAHAHVVGPLVTPLSSPIESLSNTPAIREIGEFSLYRQARYRMGTICEIRVWALCASESKAAFAAGFGEIARLDKVFSNYRPDSELAIVNAEAAKHAVRVSTDFWYLTNEAVKSWKNSNGAFDITVGPLVRAWGFHDGKGYVPTQAKLAEARAKVGSDGLQLKSGAVRFRKPGTELDFGGLAKGYASERAAQLAVSSGAVSVLVNMGGSSLCAVADKERIAQESELSASGDKLASLRAELSQWPVVMQCPSALGQPSQTMLSSGWTLSSSGSSEQSFSDPDGRLLSHIIDPRTGWPLEGHRTASVVSRSGIHGEVLTKPLLLGSRRFI
jgi:FAD:protein FMN transferase